MNQTTIYINGQRINPDEIQAMKFEDWTGDPSILQFLKLWFDDNNSVPARTSGSTGDSQIILLQKKYAMASAKATLDFLDIKPKGTALLSMPVEYIAGKMMIIRSLTGHLNLVVTPPSAVPVIPNDKIHLASFTPHQMTKLIEQGISGEHWNIENTLLGGGPVSSELQNKLTDMNGRFFETFGMTETYSHIAIRRLHPDPGEYFQAVDGVTFTQENGRLIIEAPHIGIHHLVTNDLIELLSPTAFKWLGRADFIINSGGIKLNPEIIENKLDNVLKGRFFVTGISDPVYGHKVALVLEKGEENLPESWYEEKFNQILDKYEKPKTIIWVDCMVMTPTGKINRNKTRKKYKI